MMMNSQFPHMLYAQVVSPSNRHCCKGARLHSVSVSSCHGFTITGLTVPFVSICHMWNGPRWQALISLAETLKRIHWFFFFPTGIISCDRLADHILTDFTRPCPLLTLSLCQMPREAPPPNITAIIIPSSSFMCSSLCQRELMVGT